MTFKKCKYYCDLRARSVGKTYDFMQRILASIKEPYVIIKKYPVKHCVIIKKQPEKD